MGTRSPCFWKGVLGVALALGFGVGAASGCDPTVGVSIASHQDGDTLRGTAVPVYGTASATDGLDYVRAALAGSLETDPFGVCLGSRAWSVEFDTTKISNGASKSLGATAFCCNVPAHEGSTGPIWVKIYNHYLCDVVRDTSVTFKLYNGSTWDALSGAFSALTTGLSYCQPGCGGGHTGDSHTYCTKRDTPPYTGSGTSYPSLNGEYGGDATLDSWTQSPGAYNRTEWQEDKGGDGHLYFTAVGTGSVVGRFFVNWPDRTAPCGCLRTGIHMHGGRATTDFAVALEPDQYLDITHGCIRMKNGQLQTFIEDYLDEYAGRAGSIGCIHLRVP